MRLYLKIVFIVALSFIIISCSNSIRLLPAKFRAEKDVAFKTALNKVTIYEINVEALNFSDLENYPVIKETSYRYKIQKWRKYNGLEKKEQIRILNMVKENNEYGDYNHIITLVELLQTNKDVYFSSLYSEETKDASGNPTIFYDTMYFLDAVGEKLYELHHIYDY
ncbi:hypothetical protein [Flavobacterium sp. CS20]|uniref:hypothetical protein n=1 Tax=Flavobacterium sp. CS20 TaxID=2775246 RepID=UPI001B3A13C7|nr:hypothetical protein [Flavobacterium sp. CS20]QTY26817.1 hypothetical protein IGB25_13220 [Flavobacterium sp. CS20]